MVGDAIFGSLRRFAASLRRRSGIPGYSMAVVHRGRVHAAAGGVASIETGVPASPATLFQIGSITKPMVATLALRLASRRRISLDTPVRRWIPEMRLRSSNALRRISLRHLLTHTGGWAGDYFDDTGRGEDALAVMVGRLNRLEQLTEPGAVWAYNNAGYYLVGRFVEILSGKPLDRALAEDLFSPLGMRSSFVLPEDVIARDYAWGHNVSKRRAIVARPWGMTRSAHAVGGVVASVEDLIRFAQGHLSGGILNRRLSNAAHATSVQAGCGIDAMGLGWFINERGGERCVWHSGATNGQMAHLCLVPKRGFAAAVLTNANIGGDFCADVIHRATRDFLDMAESRRSPLRLSRRRLSEYVGTYVAQMSDRILRMSGGSLMMVTVTKGGFPTPASPPLPPPPPIKLSFFDEGGIFWGIGGPFREGEFLRDGRGRVRWLRISGRLHRKSY